MRESGFMIGVFAGMAGAVGLVLIGAAGVLDTGGEGMAGIRAGHPQAAVWRDTLSPSSAAAVPGPGR